MVMREQDYTVATTIIIWKYLVLENIVNHVLIDNYLFDAATY